MQKARSVVPARQNAEEETRQEEVLWLRDFLFYRIPVLASHLLRETSLVCSKQKPTLTTAQWRIISVLANRPSLLATEISRITMLDEVAVSRALALLARRGFVQKKKNRQDKRAREVSLTPAGWRYYGAVMPRMREQNEIIRGTLSKGELSTLYMALDRIDDLFNGLIAQRRLYGNDLNLRDLADRKLHVVANGSKTDIRRKK